MNSRLKVVNERYPQISVMRLMSVESFCRDLILSYESKGTLVPQSSAMEIAQYKPHPMLELFTKESLFSARESQASDRELIGGKKLYLVPTSHGESYDPDFAPNPSPLSELPNIERWTLTYVVSALEILAGKRSPQQLARSTHRFTYNSLLRRIGCTTEVPKIRRVHRNEPIEGVIEVNVTLVFKERVRALVARFEGVDRKWLCTEFEIL
jgi:hypothetical protein